MAVMKASGSRRMNLLNDLIPEDLPTDDFPLPERDDYLQLNAAIGPQDNSRVGHFRSLSAPDKASRSSSSWDFSPRSSLNQALKESLQHWRWKMKFKGTEERKKRVLNDRRAALESDVAQLKTRLQDEKALREGLERALSGVAGEAPPQSVLPNLAPQTCKLITEITSLEKEVTHLEQHVLSLYRKVLDQRLPDRPHGGLSEPSSPRSRSETQHAMARHLESRFKIDKRSQDQSLPRPRSPQHRRYVSVASQGSKRPHSAISADRQLKTRHGSLLGSSFHSIDEEPIEKQASSTALPMNPKTSSAPARRLSSALSTVKSFSSIQVTAIPEHSTQNSIKSSSIASETSGESLDEPSSKDPNKLSEELVRCMAAIYCKLADPPLPQTIPISPSSSSSSSTTTSSPHDLSNDSWSPRWRTESNSCEMSGGPSTDPYMAKDHSLRDGVGPYSSMVEVPWICVDKDRLTYAARALRNFRSMVEQLEHVDPGQMNQDQKLAFWINIYNALMMHAYLAYGIPRNRLKRLSLLQKAAYKVGPHSINAQTIEHCILGCHSIRPALWLQSFLSPVTKFKAFDERRAYALNRPEPLVCFTLCCGGRSDPAVRVYSAKTVRSELEVAKREFLHASVKIRGENKVLMPRILEWYARELFISPTTLLELVCQNVPVNLQSRIRNCIQTKPHKSSAHCIEWLPYRFSFRYLFVRDLARRFPASAQ